MELLFPPTQRASFAPLRGWAGAIQLHVFCGMQSAALLTAARKVAFANGQSCFAFLALAIFVHGLLKHPLRKFTPLFDRGG